MPDWMMYDKVMACAYGEKLDYDGSLTWVDLFRERIPGRRLLKTGSPATPCRLNALAVHEIFEMETGFVFGIAGAEITKSPPRTISQST